MTVNLDILRSRLKSEKERLLKEMDQLKPSVTPAPERREGSPFGKREEEATETFELEKRIAMERRIGEQMAEVDHALQKFEKGTYGLCDVCGQTIEMGRLEALPQANLCVKCKAQQMKNAKGILPAA